MYLPPKRYFNVRTRFKNGKIRPPLYTPPTIIEDPVLRYRNNNMRIKLRLYVIFAADV